MATDDVEKWWLKTSIRTGGGGGDGVVRWWGWGGDGVEVVGRWRWNVGGGGEMEMVWWRLGDDGVLGWKWDGVGGLVKKG